MGLFENKTKFKHVIITGGGSGLGLGIATHYLRRGACVSVMDIQIKPAQQLQLDLVVQEHASQWQFIKMDVSQPEMVNSAVNMAIQKYGPPDLAINSAGVLINKTFEETTYDEFKRIIDINLMGSFNFSSAVLNHMKPGSRLVLIASVAGLISNYAYSAYGASKFGVVGLATSLRYEYESRGIHISCVCPPEVKTPMVEEEHSKGNKVSLELKRFAGSMGSNEACKQIVAGLDAGKWMIVPSFYAKTLVAFARILPRSFFCLMKQLISFAIKKNDNLESN